jgi:hypothetical protein
MQPLNLNWSSRFTCPQSNFSWTSAGVCYAYLWLLTEANPSQNMHRSLKILSHNIRGINSYTKWNSLWNNILESNCDIICIQETKRSPSMTRVFVIFATDL